MNRQQAENWTRTQDRLMSLGIERQDVDALFRIERTLTNWGTAECGDSNSFCSWAIERDEKTEKPYRVTYYHEAGSKASRSPIADREKGALKRLSGIMAKYPKLWAYHQSDPRGCALYVGKWSDMAELVGKPGPAKSRAADDRERVSTNYTRGVAVSY